MANPNLFNITSVYGKSTGYAVTTTNTAALTVPSNSIYKINSIIVANINGTASADITADVYKGGATQYYLAYTISVPADSTLVLLSKDASIYLEETDQLRFIGSALSYLHVLISYDILT